jgi:Late embryogenesis abundant protein.
MKRKVFIIIPIIILLIITFIIYFIPSMLYSSPKINSIKLQGYENEGENYYLKVLVNLENTASIDVYILEGEINIFNDFGEIGMTKINNINLPSHKNLTIQTKVLLKPSKALEEFLSELLSQGYANFYYSGNVKIPIPFINIFNLNVEIKKEKARFELVKVETLIDIIRIYAVEGESAKVRISLKNPTEIDLTINKVYGDLYYKGIKIGKATMNNEVFLPAEGITFINLEASINENVSLFLSDLITIKSANITYIGYAEVNFLNYNVKININSSKQVNFNFNLDAKVNSAYFENPNTLILNVDSNFSIFDIFDINFYINKLELTVYVGGEKVGTGFIRDLDVRDKTINNIDFRLSITDEGLPSLIYTFFSNKTVTITIKNIKGSIKLLNKDFNITASPSIPILVSYETLGISFEAEIYSILPTFDLKSLNVTLNLISKASNIKGLQLKIINPQFKIYSPDANITFIINAEDFIFTDYTITKINIKLNIYDPITNKLASIFLTQGKIKFLILEMNGTIEVKNARIPINFKVNQSIDVTPLSLIDLKIYAGLVTSPSLGVFEVNINATLNVTTKVITDICIIQITYDVYSGDGNTLIAKNVTTVEKYKEGRLPLVCISEPGNKTFEATIRVTITTEGLKWIAEEALQKDFISLQIRNAIIYIKLYNLPLNLTAKSFNIVAELYPRVIVQVTDFSFSPGKKAFAKVSVYSPNYNLTVHLSSLTAYLHDGITLKRFAYAQLTKIEENVKGKLIVGYFDISLLGEDPLTPLGPIIKGETIRIYGTNVSAKGIIGGKPVEIIVAQTLFIRVEAEIIIDFNATIKSFNIKPSSQSPIIDGTGILNVTIKKGFSGIINIKGATFAVKVPIRGDWVIVGQGNINHQITITGSNASLYIGAQAQISKEGFAYFGENLLSSGKVTLKFSEILMDVEIYDIKGKLPFKEITVVFLGPKLIINVININIVDIKWSIRGGFPPTVRIESIKVTVDVIVKNPFNFTVSISNISFNVHEAGSGSYLGRGSYSQQITLAPQQSFIAKDIPVDISNIGPLISYIKIDIRNGQACLTNAKAFAQGRGLANIYGITFNVDFITSKTSIPTVCTRIL